MTLPQYQRIALLVHAAAGSGIGGRYAPEVAEGVRAIFSGAEVEVIETKSKEHIREIGRTTQSDLTLCLSGDGSLHDLAQSLMQRPAEQRPVVGVIPAGSGNDYARTLGIPLDPIKAVEQLPTWSPVSVDVGCVNSVYFLETLSFGVDAAVALNTHELRLSTGARGLGLYAHAAVNAILHEFDAHQVTIRMEDREFSLKALIIAVQNGPTYGSGFQVAPRASIVDGKLDIYLVSGIRKPRALYYLTRMKKGTHERLRGFSYFNTSELELRFTEQVPIQCDGERLMGLDFSIQVIPAALEVLASPQAGAVKKKTTNL